jgi:hypothetical protein
MCWTYSFVPASSFFIRGSSSGVVAELHFKELAKILLMSGCATEVAFATVLCDGFVEASCGGLRIILLVRL